jgi:hypothetical protein
MENKHLIGRRVEIPVHTDAWMRGDRYGEIVATAAGNRVTVRMDKSERKVHMHVDSITRYI